MRKRNGINSKEERYHKMLMQLKREQIGSQILHSLTQAEPCKENITYIHGTNQRCALIFLDKFTF